ncbi:MAG: peptide chain release factor N(5)-glutamine methyltransferase [Bacteroidota bacterium]
MKIRGNQIKQVIDFFHEELDAIFGKEEVEQFIYLSFNHFHNFSRIDLLQNKENRLSESELLKYNFVVKDLKKHRPIQYILGYTWFYDLKILVNDSVLIPRPETELLVQWILNDVKAINNLVIVDVCTGSGCIALAIKNNLKTANVSAIDVSVEALKMAKQNATNLKLEVSFIELDVLKSNFSLQFLANSLDVIVSNPPYVKQSEKSLMQANVLDYEPHLALFVDDEDALLFYRVIAQQAKNVLKTAGKLYFEINEALANDVIDLLKKEGFTNIELRKDLQGKDRMIKCEK